MGEGAAAIGQFVTVVAAEDVSINVSVSVIKKAEANYSGIQEELTEALEEYLKELALETWSDDIQVRYNRISAIITDLPSVVDHENLLVNGGVDNIAFTVEQVPILGEVTVNGDIL